MITCALLGKRLWRFVIESKFMKTDDGLKKKKKHPKRVIGCLQKKGRTIIIVAFNGFGKDTRDEMLWQAHCSLSFRSYD